jgi:DNA polymerase-3 subunit gamma/tau
LPYLSLYRKYRPRTFADIVGQRHVTQTLANAVRANRIAHAYLFCGPRGTGKTSSARVLAMALNCEKGPTAEPCGVCDPCRRIIAGNALDVIEIDAASNRGIDEIRELRERVGLAPADARTKVYIIDEVHMLTAEAYNAFLKTLEEPPAHVVFVLATTEPHRVLPTILSRCQRFDFHRVGLRDLEAMIRKVAQQESIKVTEKAVTMLAHDADGSARDVLSLLDQAVAYAEDEVTPEVVTEILGGIDYDLIAEFADILIRREMPAALSFIDRVVAEGKDLPQLVASLIAHYRDLLLLSVDRRARETLSLPEEAIARAIEQAGALHATEIIRVLDMLAETDRELRFSSQPRLLVELAAARICHAPEAAAVPVAEAPPAPAAPRPRKSATATTEAKQPEPEPQTPAEPTGPAGLPEIRRRWDEVLADLRKRKHTSEAAFLRDSVPVGLEEGVLMVEFTHQFHHDQMTEKRRGIAAESVARVFGLQVTVKCRMSVHGEAGPAPEAGKPAPQGEPPAGKRPRKIDDVLSIFPGSEIEE